MFVPSVLDVAPLTRPRQLARAAEARVARDRDNLEERLDNRRSELQLKTDRAYVEEDATATATATATVATGTEYLVIKT